MTGVRRIKNTLEVELVSRLGGIRQDFADELALFIHIQRELVAEVTYSMLHGQARIGAFLASLGGYIVGRCCVLTNNLYFLLADLLFGCWNQGGINDLSAPAINYLCMSCRSSKGLKQELDPDSPAWIELWSPRLKDRLLTQRSISF